MTRTIELHHTKATGDDKKVYFISPIIYNVEDIHDYTPLPTGCEIKVRGKTVMVAETFQEIQEKLDGLRV